MARLVWQESRNSGLNVKADPPISAPGVIHNIRVESGRVAFCLGFQMISIHQSHLSRQKNPPSGQFMKYICVVLHENLGVCACIGPLCLFNCSKTSEDKSRKNHFKRGVRRSPCKHFSILLFHFVPRVSVEHKLKHLETL